MPFYGMFRGLHADPGIDVDFLQGSVTGKFYQYDQYGYQQLFAAVFPAGQCDPFPRGFLGVFIDRCFVQRLVGQFDLLRLF